MLEAVAAEAPPIAAHAALPLGLIATVLAAHASCASTNAAHLFLVLVGRPLVAAASPVPKRAMLPLAFPVLRWWQLLLLTSVRMRRLLTSSPWKLPADTALLHRTASPPFLLLTAVSVPAESPLYSLVTPSGFLLQHVLVALPPIFLAESSLMAVTAVAPLHPRAAPPLLVTVDATSTLAGGFLLPLHSVVSLILICGCASVPSKRADIAHPPARVGCGCLSSPRDASACPWCQHHCDVN